MKRTILTCMICVFLCAVCFGCTKKPTTEISWEAMAPVPFSGYICETEGSSTYIQIAAFFPGSVNPQLNDIVAISLRGNNVSLQCGNFAFSQTSTYNERSDYTLTSLNMKVNLENAGEYVVDTLCFDFPDGQIIEKELGRIHFVVEELQNQTQSLEMVQFWVNQSDLNSMRISYKNNSEYPISVESLELPDYLFSRQSVKAFHDWDITEEADDLTIPAGETRTFEFLLQPDSAYFEDENIYFLMLPYLVFSMDGQVYKMPAQTQATVIDQPYTDEFVYPLLANYS